MENRANLIRYNIERIRVEMAAAARRAGRAKDEIELLAVTKNIPIEEIRIAVASGIKFIGENKIQEARKKFFLLGPMVSWHMIGHMQTNKARSAAAIFDLVESVDSRRVADALDRAAKGLDRQLDVLIEINVAAEEQKFGVLPGQAEELVRYVSQKEHLRLRGLMAMAPYAPDTELVRPFFRHMRRIFTDLRRRLPEPKPWNILSMGMTHDFRVAIEEGSTLVRIGTGIFSASASQGGVA